MLIALKQTGQSCTHLAQREIIHIKCKLLLRKFEDTKEVTRRSHVKKNRQYNDQKNEQNDK